MLLIIVAALIIIALALLPLAIQVAIWLGFWAIMAATVAALVLLLIFRPEIVIGPLLLFGVPWLSWRLFVYGRYRRRARRLGAAHVEWDWLDLLMGDQRTTWPSLPPSPDSAPLSRRVGRWVGRRKTKAP